MKRALLILSICMMASPSFATTCKTKSCKKMHSKKIHNIHKHHRHRVRPAAKQKIVPPAKTAAASDEKKKPEAFSMSNLAGTFDIASNYVFRGISQSQNLPAVQGGLTYTFPIGLYFNVWGSNVNFLDALGNQATVEFDTIAGWRGSFWNDNISYDINIDRYNYPRARDANYNELNTLWTYKILQLGFSYSGNAYGSHQTGLYYNGAITVPIPPRYAFQLQDVTLQGEMGHYSLPRAAGNSYNDYSATLNKKINDTYTLTAQWTSTNGRQHMSPYDSSQFLGMVTANF